MPGLPAWLVILGRLLLYLPTIIKLIPAMIQAVDDVIKAIKALAADAGNPDLVVKMKMAEINRAIAEARRGETDGIIALYKFWRARK